MKRDDDDGSVNDDGSFQIVTDAGVEHDRERPTRSWWASFLIGRTFKPSKGNHRTYHQPTSTLNLRFLPFWVLNKIPK